LNFKRTDLLGVNWIYFCISFVFATMTHNSSFTHFTKTDLSIPSWCGMARMACGQTVSSEWHARHAVGDSSECHAWHVGRL